jgi:hypothetical protein
MDALRRSLAQMNLPQAAAVSAQSQSAAESKTGKAPKKPASRSTSKAKLAADASTKKPRSA